MVAIGVFGMFYKHISIEEDGYIRCVMLGGVKASTDTREEDVMHRFNLNTNLHSLEMLFYGQIQYFEFPNSDCESYLATAFSKAMLATFRVEVTTK